MLSGIFPPCGCFHREECDSRYAARAVRQQLDRARTEHRLDTKIQKNCFNRATSRWLLRRFNTTWIQHYLEYTTASLASFEQTQCSQSCSTNSFVPKRLTKTVLKKYLLNTFTVKKLKVLRRFKEKLHNTTALYNWVVAKLQCTTLHYTTLHNTTHSYTNLHYTTQDYTTLNNYTF